VGLGKGAMKSHILVCSRGAITNGHLLFVIGA